MSTIPAAAAPELSPADFRHIAALVRGVAGLNLRPGKEGLVRARLSRRLRALGLDGFPAYLARLRADPGDAELRAMVDALTTNKTSFFREARHFDHLATSVLPVLAVAGRAPCLWSAGCSTGEEPYTLAMVLRDTLPEPLLGLARILATDISARVLDHAAAARYAPDAVADVPEALRRRHLVCEADGRWRVVPELRRLVHLARLNLVGEWPMRGPFDAIFCRNVMIYFDRPTQARLVARFRALLAPGGHLFLGHAESLTGLAPGFAYAQPAVYRRAD
jgi:chemotaxis protein methyltransferase CheR